MYTLADYAHTSAQPQCRSLTGVLLPLHGTHPFLCSPSTQYPYLLPSGKILPYSASPSLHRRTPRLPWAPVPLLVWGIEVPRTL